MTTTLTLFRPRPLFTGGGGTVIEALLGLAAGVTATLAALAWRRPGDGDALAPRDREGEAPAAEEREPAPPSPEATEAGGS